MCELEGAGAVDLAKVTVKRGNVLDYATRLIRRASKRGHAVVRADFLKDIHVECGTYLSVRPTSGMNCEQQAKSSNQREVGLWP